MPTAFDEITLGYKIASIGLEIGRSVFNQARSWRNKSDHRFISSLTTFEFIQQGNDQIAHYVQDRTAKITKDNTRMPPFQYGSAGQDQFGNILITLGDPPQTTEYAHRIIERQQGMNKIGIFEDLEFSKDTILRCVLTATSINGYATADENYTFYVQHWTDVSTIFMIFPRERLPQNLNVKYSALGETQWHPVTREKNELRQFTGGRKAFILEAKNPPIGHRYKIAWRW